MDTSISLHILIIEDHAADAELMVDELRHAGFVPTIQCVEDEASYLAHLSPTIQLILADHQLPHFDGLRALQLLQEQKLDIPFIIVSGSIGEDLAVAAMKRGATDYLLKDRLTRLGEAVRHALDQKKLRDAKYQAEQAAYAAEKRFRALVEHSTDAIVLLDAEATVLYQSPGVTRILGFSPEQGIGQNSLAGLHPDDRFLAETQYRQLLRQTGGTIQMQHRVQHVDGSWRWIELSATNLLHEPDIAALVINYRDVTERRQAEVLRMQFAAIVEFSEDAIVSETLDMKVETWNRGAERLYGYTAKEMTGQSVSIVVPAERYDELTQINTRLQDGQRIAPFETVRLTKDGRKIDVMISISTIRDLAGKITGASFVAHDITELKQARAERLSAEALRIELDQRQELLQLKERFTATVSHDFRTPLAVIMMSCTLLEQYSERLGPEKRSKHLQEIQTQVRYIVELLDDVLDLSKIHLDKIKFDPHPVDVEGLCRNLFEQVQLTDTGGHQFIFLNHNQLSYVDLDEQIVQHILVNLLSNAAKYSPAGTEIQFELSSQADQLVIRVSDQGIGIPLADQAHLFEPFYRAKNVSEINGTGLGLAIVKGNVVAHGGTIAVESTEGVGTSFIVRLPISSNSRPSGGLDDVVSR